MPQVWARVLRQTISGATRGVMGVALLGAVIALALAGCKVVPTPAGTGDTGTPAATATDTAAATPAPTATPRPTATPQPTATPVPFTGKIVRIAKTVPWLTGVISISCPAGSTLVGGGVDNGYGTTAGFGSVQSSYPLSATTWRIVGPASNVSYNLTGVADCLQSSTPITTHIYKVTTPSSTYLVAPEHPVEIFSPHCATGVALGGGYDAGAGGAFDAHPNGAAGWEFTTNQLGMTAYVICASAHLNVKQYNVAVSYPLYPVSSPVVVVQSSISCPSGYLLLSGGFGQPKSSNIQISWGSDMLSASTKQWMVTGFNSSGVARTGDIYALCVQVG